MTRVWAHQQFVVLAGTLALLLTTSMGCKSTRPVMAHVYSGATDSPVRSAEPAMAANVAVKAEPVDETTSTRTALTDKRLKRPASGTELLAPPSVAPLLESDSVADGGSGSHPDDDDPTDEPIRSASSMDRLNAALKNSELESESLPQRSLTGLNERLRVDALLARAKRLLEIGQVEQAHDTALQAQNVGDMAQIEYSPDEDRPIDLVRQIEGQLEAIRLKLTPQFESPRVETAETSGFEEPGFSDESPMGTLSTDSKTPQADHDNTGLARIRRDWSTMFRQKKKGAVIDPGSAAKQAVTPTTPQPPAKQNVDSQNRQASRSAEPDARDAVVQANRSVSLGPLETEDPSAATSAFDPGDESFTEPTSISSDLPSPTDEDVAETGARRIAPVEFASDAARSTFDADESDDDPADFDVAESVTMSRERGSSDAVRSRPEIAEEDETDRQTDWTLFYIGFGLCSVLAFGCYRRGAT